VIAAIVAASSSAATPFSCGSVKFVIESYLRVFVFSEVFQSERWPARRMRIRKHVATSPVVAPVVFAGAELVIGTDA
jgi:hypothetical protein